MTLVFKSAKQVAADRAAADREVAQSAARAHLDSTDWMVIRAADGGKPIPPAVVKSRAAARKLLN